MIYTYLGIYLLLLIAISLYISKTETKEGFLIADRDRSWWVIALSKFAGAVGVGYFVAYTGYAYEFGFNVYVMILGLFIGLNLLAFWAIPKIYKNSKKEKFYTQGDYVYSQIKDNFSKNTTNIITSIILFSWVMVGMIGGASIISSLDLLSYELSLLITVVFVVSYIMISGFKAVLVTDVIQGIIILIFTGFMTFIITSSISFSDVLSLNQAKVDFATAFGFLLFGILSVFSQANYYQLIYSAKNTKSASLGLSLTIIPIIFVTTLLMFIGMFMYLQNPNMDTNLVFIEAMKNFLPQTLHPFGVLLFFVGLMSSADSNIYAIASHYSLSKQKNSTPIKTTRYFMLIIGGMSLVLGLIFRDIIDFTIFTACITITLSIPMIYIISGGKSKYRFLTSIFLGILFLFIALYFIGVKPTLVLPTILGSILGLFYTGNFNNKK